MNMSRATRKAIALVLVAAFLALALGSLAVMAHDMGGMAGDCPFSLLNVPACLPSAAVAALHHIVSYQTFLTIVPIIALALSVLLALAGAALAHAALFLIMPRAARAPLRPPERLRIRSEITRWLSRFEHSPSRA